MPGLSVDTQSMLSRKGTGFCKQLQGRRLLGMHSTSPRLGRQGWNRAGGHGLEPHRATGHPGPRPRPRPPDRRAAGIRRDSSIDCRQSAPPCRRLRLRSRLHPSSADVLRFRGCGHSQAATCRRDLEQTRFLSAFTRLERSPGNLGPRGTLAGEGILGRFVGS